MDKLIVTKNAFRSAILQRLFVSDTNPLCKELMLHNNTLSKLKYIVRCITMQLNFISYPLFADADIGIYQHAASQYHTRLKAKRSIAMLSVDIFPYMRKQIRVNEFIPWSNDLFHILKVMHNFKIPYIPFIWLILSHKHSVTRSHHSGNESRRQLWSPLWCHNDVPFPSYLTLMTSNVRYVSIPNSC